MGALWRLDVLIFRYGGPFITTKPVFYGLSHILRNQSVIAELNEQSMDQILLRLEPVFPCSFTLWLGSNNVLAHHSINSGTF
jgi:hypothetical protein